MWLTSLGNANSGQSVQYEAAVDPQLTQGLVMCTMITSMITISILVLGLVLVVKEWRRSEPVGCFLIGQMSISTMSCGLAGFLMGVSWLSNELNVNEPHGSTSSRVLIQFLGGLTNIGALTFPFTLAIRYFYYFWVVVLERQIKPVYWITTCVVFWSLAVTLTLTQGIFFKYRLRSTQIEVTSPYYDAGSDWLVMSNVLFYIMVIIVGGSMHLFFSIFILAKFISKNNNASRDPSPRLSTLPPSRPTTATIFKLHNSPINDGDSQNLRRFSPSFPLSPNLPSVDKPAASRWTIIKKFLPVTVTYIVGHGPFATMVLYELVHQRPAPMVIQYAYGLLYTLTSLACSILIIYTNRKLYHTLKLLLARSF